MLIDVADVKFSCDIQFVTTFKIMLATNQCSFVHQCEFFWMMGPQVRTTKRCEEASPNSRSKH
jgi:hypothetical protein